MENWRDIPGYEGFYQISDQGRVKSLPRIHEYTSPFGSGNRSVSARIMRQSVRKNGYLCVSLWRDGVRQSCLVHHLVAAAFIGSRPRGMHVCHNNSDRTDNRLLNLRYDTPRGNALDAVAAGTSSALRLKTKGEDNGNAKLTADQVARMRSLLDSGERMKTIATMFGVSYSLVKRIRRGEVWNA